LHDAGGNAAGKIVLEECPALPHDMPMALPAHEVGQSRDQDLVDDDGLRDVRARLHDQQQHRHQPELEAGFPPNRLGLLHGYQRDDAADANRNRGIGDGNEETGGEQRQQRPRDLPHEMPIEPPDGMRAAGTGGSASGGGRSVRGGVRKSGA
jgi:hypothetical protein